MDFDAAACKKDAEDLLASAKGMSEEALLASDDFQQVKESQFKYSLQFGQGIIELMKAVGTTPSAESIERWCNAINLKSVKSLTRDWEYQETQMRQLENFKVMMAEMNAAAKRNEAERLKKKAEDAAKAAENPKEP